MMGAQLVARVYTYWTDLPDRPFRLLVGMALLVKDTNADPLYWGGREKLCQSLGLPDDSASSRAMVKRALQILADAGAIKLIRAGRSGKRSEYRLTLDRGAPQYPLRGTLQLPLRGTPELPHGELSSTPLGEPHSAPLGTTEEPTEENKEEPKSPRNSRLRRDWLAEARLTPERTLELVTRIDQEAATP